MKKIPESLLHYVWETKQFNTSSLLTVNGHSISIKSFGLKNTFGGPDFFDAKIKIGNTLWVGHVEMHVKSSDWTLHNHHNDPSYSSVILHVVYEHDKSVSFNSSDPNLNIPTIELKQLIPQYILDNYSSLIHNDSWLPCEKILTSDHFQHFNLWKFNLVTERLWVKIQHIYNIHKQSNGDWEKTAFIISSRSFGGTANKDNFERLAQTLDRKLIIKNAASDIIPFSYILGQAGLLNTPENDKYIDRLRQEYTYLKRKYTLKASHAHTWVYGGVRPPGYPPIRLVQWGAFVSKTPHLFSTILTSENIRDYYDILDINLNDYWSNHYKLGIKSKVHNSGLTKNVKNRLMINFIIPLLFAYGKSINNDRITNKAIDLLEKISYEKLKLVSRWEKIGLSFSSALDSQAILHLDQTYCKLQNCLRCKIGHQIISNL